MRSPETPEILGLYRKKHEANLKKQYSLEKQNHRKQAHNQRKGTAVMCEKKSQHQL